MSLQRGQDGWRLTSEAFNDPILKPSVDRASIRTNAADSLRGVGHGIAQLLTVEVRACKKVIQNPWAKNPAEQIPYKLLVTADPVEDGNAQGLPPNPSHALIETDPALANPSRFRKVKDALCRLAEQRPWVVQPAQIDSP